jgi:hypothetical protein
VEHNVGGSDPESIEEVPQPSLELATSLDPGCGGQDKKALGEIDDHLLHVSSVHIRRDDDHRVTPTGAHVRCIDSSGAHDRPSRHAGSGD